MLPPSRFLIALSLLALSVAARAGEAKKPPLDFPGLKFRLVGPFVGGRASRVQGIAGDPFTYYVSTASGGVWKSTDGGVKWKPIFDDMDISSIGSIAVAPSDPNVVYVGSGEANIRGNVAAGNGIYKSTDAGKTWTHIWKQEGQIGTLIVHPKNPDLAYAAVLGHAFGPNPERGVYRTADGGKTWQQVLKKDAETGASDVCMDPNNPRVLFAGLWQARRKPWDLVSGGPGSGLFASKDGGDTWKELGKDEGIPEGIKGKIGCAVAPSDGQRVYALIEAEKGGLYRSDDGGKSFTLANAHRSLRQRAWYYSTLTIDPTNADIVWFPQVSLVRTIDGGKTVQSVQAHHGDLHDAWIDPKNSSRMITAHDGGVSVSTDGGKSWLTPELPIAQFYHVATDTSVPYRVHGAMQDMGTASGPSNSLKNRGIGAGEWLDVGGGEAGHTQSEPGNPDIVYAGEYLGIFTRFDRKTGQARKTSAYPENGSGHGPVDLNHRFQWTAPILVSPHDPKTVYHAAEVVFKTRDGGQTWAAISGDLTRNDKTKQQWAGGPITGDNTGVEYFGTVFALAESKVMAGVIWSGSDDGLVQVTQDAGKTWTNVTANMPKFTDFATVSLIEASPFDAGAAYVVVDAHRLDDMKPYLFKTTDYGRTWKTLSTAMKQDVYLHAVREDPKKRGMLYVGTERGVIFSRDDGATWEPLKLNLPTVAVSDLRVQENDLVVGTNGRSIWILDNLASLREWKPETKTANAHLFPVTPSTRWRYSGNFHDYGAKGQNPPAAAMIEYFLKAKSEKEVTIEILDATGGVVRTLSSMPEPQPWPIDDPDEGREEDVEADLKNDAGVQRAFWDFRYEGARKIWKAKIDLGDPGEGPLASPGTYSARLNVDGKTYVQPLVVSADPRVAMSASDYEDQLSLSLSLRHEVTRLTKMVEGIRAVRTQVSARKELVQADPAAADWIKMADSLLPKLAALEEKLHNPTAEVTYDILAFKGGAKLYSRISPLYSFVVENDGVPTQGMLEVFATYKAEMDALDKEWMALVAGDIATLSKATQPAIVIPSPSSGSSWE
ncbi:MAG: glycosyl hydrolase [Vicinamibacteria bacterium]|nr:glycosyl hydrolase [Vicinamibacteria bacterium]